MGGIVAFRAVWGLGNALFIATALATIVSAAMAWMIPTPPAIVSITAARTSPGRATMSDGRLISATAASASRPVRATSSLRLCEVSTVPYAASAIDPPRLRKNMIVAVVTPRSRNSHAFCAAIEVVV